MTHKHKSKNEDSTNKKLKKSAKTFPKQNNTLENFIIVNHISTTEKVEKIWSGLNREEKLLLKDEFNQMHVDWLYLLKNELQTDYYLNIKRQIKIIEDKGIEILPPRNLRFRCFKYSPNDISVIIVGQDPYPNDADGLAFSSKSIKPSLRAVFNLLKWDLGAGNWKQPKTGSLEKWSKNVLLINSILTVEKGKSKSHEFIGWQKFTDNVIKLLGNKQEIVTMLWGKYAKEKADLLKNGYIIKSGHPSPMNRE